MKLKENFLKQFCQHRISVPQCLFLFLNKILDKTSQIKQALIYAFVLIVFLFFLLQYFLFSFRACKINDCPSCYLVFGSFYIYVHYHMRLLIGIILLVFLKRFSIKKKLYYFLSMLQAADYNSLSVNIKILINLSYCCLWRPLFILLAKHVIHLLSTELYAWNLYCKIVMSIFSFFFKNSLNEKMHKPFVYYLLALIKYSK